MAWRIVSGRQPMGWFFNIVPLKRQIGNLTFHALSLYNPAYRQLKRLGIFQVPNLFFVDISHTIAFENKKEHKVFLYLAKKWS